MDTKGGKLWGDGGGGVMIGIDMYTLMCRKLVTNNNLLYKKINEIQKVKKGASLVAQWLRICLPMQGARVRALVWEDPTCHGAT